MRPGGGGAQGPAFLQVAELYQHKLQHTAANMAHGPFGGIQGIEMKALLCLGQFLDINMSTLEFQLSLEASK